MDYPEGRIRGLPLISLIPPILGMHGESLFLQGEVDQKRLGKKVKIGEETDDDT